jgi:hypothetical protein
MVVVGIAAQAIHGFPIFAQNYIYFACSTEGLKCSVHRGQTDAVAALLQVFMYFLGRSKVLKFVQSGTDRRALFG